MLQDCRAQWMYHKVHTTGILVSFESTVKVIISARHCWQPNSTCHKFHYTPFCFLIYGEIWHLSSFESILSQGLKFKSLSDLLEIPSSIYPSSIFSHLLPSLTSFHQKRFFRRFRKKKTKLTLSYEVVSIRCRFHFPSDHGLCYNSIDMIFVYV